MNVQVVISNIQDRQLNLVLNFAKKCVCEGLKPKVLSGAAEGKVTPDQKNKESKYSKEGNHSQRQKNSINLYSENNFKAQSCTPIFLSPQFLHLGI